MELIDIVNRNHKAFANRDIDDLAVRLNAISAKRRRKGGHGVQKMSLLRRKPRSL